ncbi:MAG: hypothetical protein QOH32_3212 [Bradyrhizobium sp.]|jgi:hypothetical protein|nr:hypothetical protein [Bradyrhizobium sp.]
MSASNWITVIVAILLVLIVVLVGWRLRRWYTRMSAATNADGSTPTDQASSKLGVFKRLEPIEYFAKWYLLTVAVLIGVFALSIAVRNTELQRAVADFLLAVSVSFVVALASTATGCFLGFLFGIPKSLQRGAAAPQPQQQPTSGNAAAEDTSGNNAARTSGPAFGTNTSLEEISDWLTKIIIGLGLVQFQTFLTYLYNAALFAASYIAQSDLTIDTTQQNVLQYKSALSSPFLFALILTCLVAACLFAYLQTRTRLTQLFLEQKRDEDRLPVEVKVEYRETLQTDTSSDDLRKYLWPDGTYDDDRRKTLNNLLMELGITQDVRLILVGEEGAESRKRLIALARKKNISLTGEPDTKTKT